MIEDISDTHYEALNWGFGEILWFGRAGPSTTITSSSISSPSPLYTHLATQAKSQTATLQTWLATQLGDSDFLNGDNFGWADIAAVPMVNRSVYYGFKPDKGGRLDAWMERVKRIDSVRRTLEEFDGAVGGMAGMKDAFRKGRGRKREYRDHRLEWLVKSGGVEIVLEGLRDGNVRFSWPGAGY